GLFQRRQPFEQLAGDLANNGDRKTPPPDEQLLQRRSAGVGTDDDQPPVERVAALRHHDRRVGQAAQAGDRLPYVVAGPRQIMVRDVDVCQQTATAGTAMTGDTECPATVTL